MLPIITREEINQRYDSLTDLQDALQKFVTQVHKKIDEDFFKPEDSEAMAPLVMYAIIADTTQAGQAAIRIVARSIDIEQLMANEQMAIATCGAILLHQVEVISNSKEAAAELSSSTDDDVFFTENARLMGMMLQSTSKVVRGEAREGVDVSEATVDDIKDKIEEDVVAFQLDMSIGSNFYHYVINTDEHGKKQLSYDCCYVTTIENDEVGELNGSHSLLTMSMDMHEMITAMMEAEQASDQTGEAIEGDENSMFSHM